MSNVVVSVEPLAEKRVKEFLPAGGEVYVEPLSQADLLTKNAQRVDFGVRLQEEMEKEEVKEEGASSSATNGADPDKTKHPWEGATKHLRSALEEMNVLCDVLHMSQQRHYLLPDAVSQEPVRSQPALQLHLAKTNLSKAASILLRGASAVKSVSDGQTSDTRDSASSGDATAVFNVAGDAERHEVCEDGTPAENRMFYDDLQGLCRSWAMRRVNQQISGDLALCPEMSNPLSRFSVERRPVGDSGTRMDVVVAAELRSSQCIRVFTSKKANVNPRQLFAERDEESARPKASKPSWLQALETAEEALICRDIFHRLGNDSGDSWCTHRVIRRSNWLLIQLGIDSWLHVVRVKPSSRQASVALSGAADTAAEVAELCIEADVLADLHRHYLATIKVASSRPAVTTMLSTRKWKAGSGFVSPRSESLLQRLITLTSFTLNRRQVAERLTGWQRGLRDMRCIVSWLPPSCAMHCVVNITLTTEDVKPAVVSTVNVTISKDSVAAANSAGFQYKNPYADESLSRFLASCVTHHNWKLIRDLLNYWRWRAVGETRSVTEYRLLAASSFHFSELRVSLSTNDSQSLRVLETCLSNDQAGLRKTVRDLSALHASPAATSIAKHISACCAQLAKAV